MDSDRIDYDALIQDALRGAVRDMLRRVAVSGLPGAHHFYIAFRTRAPGVVIPDHLRARYPDEMTIVLQHRFWDLEAGDDAFSIRLSFNGKPERLVIPYAALAGFVDPSVQFALQFPGPADKDKAAPDAGKPPAGDTTADAAPAPSDEETGGDAKVVTLDAFRRKP